ncbi:MAG: peptidoglycan recognition family protein [Phycisphaerae bacterium]|nr:peptidoglycan recognition family protein [Phycisphaerae bacterium]
MRKKIVVFIVLAYLPALVAMFAGCAEEESYTPQISGTVLGLHHSGQTANVYRPAAISSYKSHSSYSSSGYTPKSRYKSNSSAPYGWIPSSSNEKRWKAVVIHHSGTDTGNVSSIDDYHRKNNGWDGIGYDFVIGNGSGCGNGQIDPTFRWIGQKVGAHCKTDNSNWANKDAIGICLIGNFDYSRPSGSQMTSLMKLIRFLSDRYNIPATRIYGHNSTPGHSTNTNCPGRNLSISYVKTNL